MKRIIDDHRPRVERSHSPPISPTMAELATPKNLEDSHRMPTHAALDMMTGQEPQMELQANSIATELQLAAKTLAQHQEFPTEVIRQQSRRASAAESHQSHSHQHVQETSNQLADRKNHREAGASFFKHPEEVSRGETELAKQHHSENDLVREMQSHRNDISSELNHRDLHQRQTEADMELDF